MKLVTAATAVATLLNSASSLPLTSLTTNPLNSEYIIDESTLSSLLEDPPSFISTAESTGFSTDIVSLGSVTRMDYLTAQMKTWASHKSVRNYWGFSELQDFNPECSAMSDEDLSIAVDRCKTNSTFADPKLKSFAKYYGISEGNRVRSNDAGWVCAQRRLGRALGWLHSQYSGGESDIPDYLMIVDDDTYVDLVDVMSYLEKQENVDVQPLATAGCLIDENKVTPFPMPYGGFGTILNKASIQHLSKAIYCIGDKRVKNVCSQIKANKIGELNIFQDGMTIFELFFKYSALNSFCMHSDWLLGYIFKYYLSHSGSYEGETTLKGIKNYPACGNFTVATGALRQCNKFMRICHEQIPNDMEALAVSSYAKSPDSYHSIPMIGLADANATEDAVKNFAYVAVLGWNPDESKNKLYLGAMRVMIQSLKESIADVVVLMMYRDEEAEALLVADGAIVKHITPLNHSLEIPHFKTWFVDIAFAKLRAFELTEYNRVQFLDVDAYIKSVKEMDKLFTSFPNVKLVAEGLGSDSPLRAGWLLIRPSYKDFQEIQEILERGVFTNAFGWDNLDLDVKYPGWTPTNPFNKWEFYGSNLEQGLLFHYFYALPKSIDSSAQDSKLLTIFDDDTLVSLGFIHFYGNRKPWLMKYNDDRLFPSHISDARKKWLHDFDLLNSVYIVSHETHLTKYGVAQYRRAQVLDPYDEPSISPITVTSPSLSPSASTQTSPSSSPIHSSTKPPIISRTTTPSGRPSASPSLGPSVSPSSTPSKTPRLSPTASPTASTHPSTSLSPSTGTKTPTTSPSTNPSAPPSTSPSKPPSFSPSSGPSKSPSAAPSAQPTSSSQPSTSLSPSTGTSTPTTSLTASPSSSPSTSPNVPPSASPTGGPSASPSTGPSVSPFGSPSSTPSKSPSSPPSKTPSLSPTASPTASTHPSTSLSPSTGTKTPTTSPTLTPFLAIDMLSVMEWNLDCSETNSTSLVVVANIIEESTFNLLNSTINSSLTLDYVYVHGLCNQTVTDYIGFSSSRSLQSANSISKITMSSRVVSYCTNCQEAIFNEASKGLETIVDDGSLSIAIQEASENVIQAVISPGVMSTYTVITNSPTAYPTISSQSPTKGTNSPIVSPSSIPSNKPSTSDPSSSPNTPPSTPPSTQPSISPISSPSQNPSISPIFPPSGSPIGSPSISPIVSTTKPTTSPSIVPSISPMFSPSAPPSNNPGSSSPSSSPSITPTISPSTQPSIGPSFSPSRYPSISPIFPPSGSPISSPSVSPTVSTTKPTSSPSTAPSSSPMFSPSSSPSNRPSTLGPTRSKASKSKSPTTIVPTISPTMNPSAFPSTNPSDPPSTSPSSSPTKAPTTSTPTTLSPTTAIPTGKPFTPRPSDAKEPKVPKKFVFHI